MVRKKASPVRSLSRSQPAYSQPRLFTSPSSPSSPAPHAISAPRHTPNAAMTATLYVPVGFIAKSVECI